MKRPDVEQFLDELGPEQVDKWDAFDAVEPIGVNRLYEILAQIGSAIYTSQGNAVHPQKFMPWVEVEEPQTTGEADLAACRGGVMALAMSGV